jgi:hypothetical protein
MKALKTGVAILAIIIFAGAIFFAVNQKNKGVPDTMNAQPIKPDMSYRTEGAYMPFKHVQINLSRDGKGTIAYQLYEEYTPKGAAKAGEKVISITLEPTMIQGIESLYEKVNFFNMQVNDLNKDNITVTDMGTTTVFYSKDGKERTLSYGYVNDNKTLDELVRQYRSLADQYLPKPVKGKNNN